MQSTKRIFIVITNHAKLIFSRVLNIKLNINRKQV